MDIGAHRAVRLLALCAWLPVGLSTPELYSEGFAAGQLEAATACKHTANTAAQKANPAACTNIVDPSVVGNLRCIPKPDRAQIGVEGNAYRLPNVPGSGLHGKYQHYLGCGLERHGVVHVCSDPAYVHIINKTNPEWLDENQQPIFECRDGSLPTKGFYDHWNERYAKFNGQCVSWQHPWVRSGQIWNGECSPNHYNRTTDRVCTKALVSRPDSSASLRTGMFMLKRTRCFGQTCHVYKQGFCMRVEKDVFSTYVNNQNPHYKTEVSSWIQAALNILRAHPAGLPDKYQCRDGAKLPRIGHCSTPKGNAVRGSSRVPTCQENNTAHYASCCQLHGSLCPCGDSIQIGAETLKCEPYGACGYDQDLTASYDSLSQF